MIFTIDSDSDERRDQVNEWFDASQRERIAEALLDANGLRPTEAALDVIMAVVEATDRLDESWDGNITIPAPPMASYARHAEGSLRVLRRAR